MSPRVLRNRVLSWALPLSVILGLGACGSSDESPADSKSVAKGADGSKCSSNSACVSNLCQSGVCVGDGRYTAANDACTSSTQCASGICTAGKCAAGQALPNDYSCASNTECQSGVCSHGACAAPASTASGSGGQGNGNVVGSSGQNGVTTPAGTNPTGTTPSGTTTNPDGTVVTGPSSSFTTTDGAPPFQGMGTEWRPLTTGCDPTTATECGGACEARGTANAKVVRAPAVFCFGADPAGGAQDPTPENPAAMIEQVIETVNGTSYVHIRVTLDPAFVDNTFGANASAGWGEKGHTFVNQLTNSDHLELLLTDASSATVMDFKIDYITSLVNAGKPGKPGRDAPGAGGATSTAPTGVAGGPASCQFDSLGVTGGDGSMVKGNAADVLAATSSLDRNVAGCGYCANAGCGPSGDCTVDSPATDANYTPNPLAPNWNFAVSYEVWLKASAFDAGGGFGQAYITFVHASPSMATNDTLNVVPSPCPPTWVSCPPGQTCPPGKPGDPGNPGTGGASGVGGSGNVPSTPACPVNYQLRTNADGSTVCSPIPYAGWPDRAACPAGYKFFLDISNETQYCVMQ